MPRIVILQRSEQAIRRAKHAKICRKRLAYNCKIHVHKCKASPLVLSSIPKCSVWAVYMPSSVHTNVAIYYYHYDLSSFWELTSLFATLAIPRRATSIPHVAFYLLLLWLLLPISIIQAQLIHFESVDSWMIHLCWFCRYHILEGKE